MLLLASNMWTFCALVWLLAYLPYAAMGSGVLWRRYQRTVNWNVIDYSVLVLPAAAWLALLDTDSRVKGWVNVLWEPVSLGFLAFVAPAIRVALNRKLNDYVAAALAVTAVTGLAALMWAIVPALSK